MILSLRLRLGLAPTKGRLAELESDSHAVLPSVRPRLAAASALWVAAGLLPGCFADLEYLRSGADGGGGNGRGGTLSDAGAGAVRADVSQVGQDSSVQGARPDVPARDPQDGANPDVSADVLSDKSPPARTDIGIPEAGAGMDGDKDPSTGADSSPGARRPDAAAGDGAPAPGRQDGALIDARADGPAPPDATPFVSLIPVLNEDGGCDLGRADTNINAVSFRHNGLLTVGDYQFIAYYGLVSSSSYGAVVGRRHTGAKSWTLTRTAFVPSSADWRSSAAIQFGIDGSGVLHMGWGGIGSAAGTCYYTQSTDSVLNDAPIGLIGGDIGNAGSLSASTAGSVFPLSNDSTIQTTEFYSVPKTGDLLLTFRTGSTGNGHYQLARWDNVGKSWLQVHATITEPWIQGGDGTYGSPYVNQLAFGSDGTLHATWTYRNQANTVNSDLFYARSLDDGATWLSADGNSPYASPLTWTNPAPVLPIGPTSSGGFNLVNQCGTATDRRGHPAVACWYSPSAASSRQIMVMWHDGRQWRTAQVSNRNVSDSNTSDLARPILLVDDDDRWWVVWRDSKSGSNGVKVGWSLSAERDDWTVIDLTTESLGQWEPVYDLTRWERDRVVSLYYQNCGTGSGGNASAVSVLEFRARDYVRRIRDGG